MTFFESHHLSLLQVALVTVPIAFALCFHAWNFTLRLFGTHLEPFYDPWPMRLWTGLALFSGFLAAAGIPDLPYYCGGILYVTAIYMINRKYRWSL